MSDSPPPAYYEPPDLWTPVPVCDTKKCGQELTQEDQEGSAWLSRRLGVKVRHCGPCLEKQEEIRRSFGGE